MPLKEGSEVFAIHLRMLPACRDTYQDSLLWVAGVELIYGTLYPAQVHNVRQGQPRWKVQGLSQMGDVVTVSRQPTKRGAIEFIRRQEADTVAVMDGVEYVMGREPGTMVPRDESTIRSGKAG